MQSLVAMLSFSTLHPFRAGATRLQSSSWPHALVQNFRPQVHACGGGAIHTMWPLAGRAPRRQLFQPKMLHPANCVRPLSRARCQHPVASASESAEVSQAAKSPLTELARKWQKLDGEHGWLEDPLGDEALAWVRQANANAIERLGPQVNSQLYERIYGILTSKEQIPYLRKIGTSYYNFWTDDANPRGVWRRTDLESYASGDPEWETLISVDVLGCTEGESWVWKGHTLLKPRDGSAPSRTLVQLSRGGADAVVVREFDLEAKRFVPASEGGFEATEAKTRVSWLDADTLLIGTDVGGASMTDSGYPRTVREWRRGADLAEAVEVFAGEQTDVSVSGYTTRHGGVEFEWTSRGLSFYTSERRLRPRGADGVGEWAQLAVPDDCSLRQFEDQLLISLRTEWLGHAAGSLLAAPAHELTTATQTPSVQVLFTPTERTAIKDITITRSKVLLSVLDNVRSSVLCLSRDADGAWREEGAESAAEHGVRRRVLGGVSLAAVDADESDDVWMTTWSYTQPSELHLASASNGAAALFAATPLRALPPMWDASGARVIQSAATSADGTSVPFFVVMPDGAQTDGAPVPRPTLLYGYGGFAVSMTPKYLSTWGAGWVEQGGCYVEACIRGGGEFGPEWHKAALREKRNKAYEDFEAVAEALVAQGICTPAQLACRGGSNGGLLVGNMLVRRPELFGAVVCAVPLLDMRRYNKLLAGASWMAEFGDPDTADWDDFLWQYSPYHNIDPNVRYPPLLMTTSTRDDRVHPYHARAFVKRLVECGNDDATTYYENIEGGHGGAADPKQSAFMLSLNIEFLKQTIGRASPPS